MRSYSKFLFAVLTGCCFEPCPGVGPTWWKLVGRGDISGGWHLCNVYLYRDIECTKPVGPFKERKSSPWQTNQHSFTPGLAWSDWKSDCGPEKPDKPCLEGTYIAVGFFAPTMVQCVQFTTPLSYSGSCTTTTLRVTKITKKLTTATTSTATTITTTPGTTVTVTNPFLGIDFGGRRLATPFPAKVTLERSEDGSVWSRVVEWSSVSSFTIASGKRYSGTYTVPRKVSGVPASMPCSLCARTTTGAIQAKQSVELTFSQWITPGSGRIKITRGTLSSITQSSYLTTWFKFSGSKLTITPQAAWGLPSTCAIINFERSAVVDADGLGNAAFSYTMCIADTLAPTMTTSTPKNGAFNVAQQTTSFKLDFAEAVKVEKAGSATLKVSISRDSTKKEDFSIAMKDVQTETWNRATGANSVILRLPLGKALARQTTYELQLPGGSIKDRANNAWIPTTLTFTTAGVSPGSTTTLVAAVPGAALPKASSSGEGGGVPVWIFLVLGIGVLMCCGCCLLYLGWRNYVLSMRQQIKLNTKVAPAQQAASPHSHSAPTNQFSQPDVHKAKSAPVELGGPRLAGHAGSSPKAKPNYRGAAKSAANLPEGPDLKARARAKNDEDVPAPQRRAPPPFHSREKEKKGPGLKRGASFTDDDISDGGWTKAVDAGSGRPYWFNRQTCETTWEKPSGKASPSGQADRPQPTKQSAQSAKAPSTPTILIDVKPVEEAEGVARVKEDLQKQLEKTLKEDGPSRKKTFKFLLLRWHPDKNPENPELATAVFQFLQDQRAWYLKDAE